MTELIGGEGERLGEDGAQIAVDDLDGAEQAEDGGRTRVEAIGWSPPVSV